MSGWWCCTTPCHPMCVCGVCMATRWCGGCAHRPIHTNTVVWAWRSMVRVVSVEVVVAHLRHVVHAQRPRADPPHKQPRGHAGLAPPLSAHRVRGVCGQRVPHHAHIAHPHAKPLHHPPCHTHACRVQPWCQTHNNNPQTTPTHMVTWHNLCVVMVWWQSAMHCNNNNNSFIHQTHIRHNTILAVCACCGALCPWLVLCCVLIGPKPTTASAPLACVVLFTPTSSTKVTQTTTKPPCMASPSPCHHHTLLTLCFLHQQGCWARLCVCPSALCSPNPPTTPPTQSVAPASRCPVARVFWPTRSHTVC